MKRSIFVLCILVLATAILPAQVDFATFSTAFQSFADAAAGSLASTATSGLAWSPAYIGQFPHFGVGITVGAAMMPYDAIQPVLGMLSITLPPEVDFLQTIGVPLPAAAIDARIGGFAIPFDIGLKIGFIPEQVKALMGSVQADYFIAGGDVRYAILQDEGMVPGLSVGVGYSYLKGGVEVAGLLGSGQDIDITAMMSDAGYTDGSYILRFTDPTVGFTWESHVIEAKAQVSKNLLIFTPHAGVSAAYALSSSVGGGLNSTVSLTGLGTMATFADVQQVFTDNGYTAPSSQGISVAASAPAGWAIRLFGGTSVNLSVLRLDLDATWNVLTGSYGGSVNLRFQM